MKRIRITSLRLDAMNVRKPEHKDPRCQAVTRRKRWCSRWGRASFPADKDKFEPVSLTVAARLDAEPLAVVFFCKVHARIARENV